MSDPVRWCADHALAVNPTLAEAREALVECFLHAQRETFSRARETLGHRQPSDAQLHRQISAGVRSALREVGGQWDAPTADELLAAVALLADRALAWGTPPDIVQHHRQEMEQVIGRATA